MNGWMIGISKFKDDHASLAVASPGFVARRAKLEIRSRGTHGGLQGRVQQLLDDLL